jgi:hypothetical protein
MRKCEQCDYWRRIESELSTQVAPGHCHRFPPSLANQHPDAPSARKDMAAWAQPVTSPVSWCGEFRSTIQP